VRRGFVAPRCQLEVQRVSAWAPWDPEVLGGFQPPRVTSTLRRIFLVDSRIASLRPLPSCRSALLAFPPSSSRPGSISGTSPLVSAGAALVLHVAGPVSRPSVRFVASRRLRPPRFPGVSFWVAISARVCITSACGPCGPPAHFPLRTCTRQFRSGSIRPAPPGTSQGSACAFPVNRSWCARSARAAVLGPGLSRSSFFALAGSAHSWDHGFVAHRFEAASYHDPSGFPAASSCLTPPVGRLPSQRGIRAGRNPRLLRITRVSSSGSAPGCRSNRSSTSHSCVWLVSVRTLLGFPRVPALASESVSATFEVSPSGPGYFRPSGSVRLLARTLVGYEVHAVAGASGPFPVASTSGLPSTVESVAFAAIAGIRTPCPSMGFYPLQDPSFAVGFRFISRLPGLPVRAL